MTLTTMVIRSLAPANDRRTRLYRVSKLMKLYQKTENPMYLRLVAKAVARS
jgi:hypothetical protein